MNAKERAERMAGNLHGVLLDYEEETPSVIALFFAKEIHEAEEAARREAIEEPRLQLPMDTGCQQRGFSQNRSLKRSASL